MELPSNTSRCQTNRQNPKRAKSAVLVIMGILVLYLLRHMLFQFRGEQDAKSNIKAGFFCVILFFMVISILVFPKGPITRPHPAVWRMCFGLNLIYLMLLVFCLFQNYETIMQMLSWCDPEFGYRSAPIEYIREDNHGIGKVYDDKCWDITFDRVWYITDMYAAGHLLGWAIKAMVVRHLGVLWAGSILWEFTEVAFTHMLSNLSECWWDSMIMDVLVCNGLGIWVGLKICKMLEMREYNWGHPLNRREVEESCNAVYDARHGASTVARPLLNADPRHLSGPRLLASVGAQRVLYRIHLRGTSGPSHSDSEVSHISFPRLSYYKAVLHVHDGSELQEFGRPLLGLRGHRHH